MTDLLSLSGGTSRRSAVTTLVHAAAARNIKNATVCEVSMFFVLISSLLLILSFPKFSFWPAAWFSLVPIFYSIRREKSLRFSFFKCYAFGFIFFLVTLEWLRHVSYFGWIFVVFFYSFLFGFFGLAIHWLWKRNLFFLSLFVLPSAWCVLEWMRTEIPVLCFGWNLLAYSQAFNPTISGMASIVGAYGLSWLIVFANLAVFFILDFELNHKKSEGVLALVGILSLALIFGFYFTHELNSLKSSGIRSDVIKVSVIQPNIPQEQKWDPAFKDQILETHERLSELAAGDDRNHPDLIVWPEASYPGFFNTDPDRNRVFTQVDRLKTPILFGGLHQIENKTGEHYYNSAYLIWPGETEPKERYDKIRLVSFGEYVPWRDFFSLFGLERLAYSLGVSDFEPGKKLTVFSLDPLKKFSALICFEDTFPHLARQAVTNGAQFLTVLTNDAWFSKSAAPYQHLQASIFRAIENGVPVIRSANTGVSAVIGADGTVIERVQDSFGNDTFIAGGISVTFPVAQKKTCYRSIGYLLPCGCLILLLVSFGMSVGANLHVRPRIDGQTHRSTSMKATVSQ